MIHTKNPFFKFGGKSQILDNDDARAIVETNNNNHKALLKRQPYQTHALIFQELKDYAIIDGKVYSVKPDIPEVAVFSTNRNGVMK